MLEGERSYSQWLANQEDLRADHSISALRKKTCKNAWNEDRLCYVHVRKGVARVTRCHVHLVKNGNGILLSVHSAKVNQRGSGNTNAVSMNEGSQLRVAHRAGIIALDNGASLRWLLSVGWRLIRLPVPSRDSQRGIILAVVVIPSHHDILGLVIVIVLDFLHHHIDFVQQQRVHIRGRDRM